MTNLQAKRDALVTLRRQRHELQRKVDALTIEVEAAEREYHDAAESGAVDAFLEGLAKGVESEKAVQRLGKVP